MLRTLTPALGLLLLQLHAAPVQAATNAAADPQAPAAEQSQGPTADRTQGPTADRTMDQNSRVVLPAPPPEPAPPPAPPLRHFTRYGR